MDWLRIAAFALLILYHIGMVFAPWPWVVKLPPAVDALIVPMALPTPWRLALLFAVSGFASRRLFDRAVDARGFLAERSRRLLVPLAFAMVALVPVEMWVRVRLAGYPGSYAAFWLGDYWRIGTFWGREFPSWEHLWFVAYLWTYTAVVAVALALGRRRLAAVARRVVGWASVGRRILWAPIAVLGAAKLALMFLVAERQGLVSDWGGHAEYLPLFVAGFVLAGPDRAPWRAIARVLPQAAFVAGLAGAVAVAVEQAYPGAATPGHALMALDRIARLAMAWSMVLLLFHLADRHLDRDHRWRRPLAEAVFPAYLLHHGAIVLTAWWLIGAQVPQPVAAAVLLGVTLAVCAAGYAVARRVGWLRPLLGLGASAHR